MLRIWRVSGQELPPINMKDEKIRSVRDLKRSLRSLHGFPLCMQQLLHDGNTLDNTTQLDAAMDLQLVLLPLATADQKFEAGKELLKACGSGDLETARFLLEAGIDKDFRNPDGGETPLLRAVEDDGHAHIVQLLLKAGAHANRSDYFGEAPLMYAARNGHVEIAQLLLEAGADKNLANDEGETALMIAAGNPEMQELLANA